jgi:hypothetical protein
METTDLPNMIKGYITNSEGILKPIFFTGFIGNKFGAVTGVFTKDPIGLEGI